MGLGRAFLGAGSQGVLMSLWPVASEPTVRLMVIFYGHVTADMEPAEAIRQSKIEMRAKARNKNSPEQHPYYWAPFVLFGG